MPISDCTEGGWRSRTISQTYGLLNRQSLWSRLISVLRSLSIIYVRRETEWRIGSVAPTAHRAAGDELSVDVWSLGVGRADNAECLLRGGLVSYGL